MVEPTHLKNLIVKMVSFFPTFGMNIKTIFELPPPSKDAPQSISYIDPTIDAFFVFGLPVSCIKCIVDPWGGCKLTLPSISQNSQPGGIPENPGKHPIEMLPEIEIPKHQMGGSSIPTTPDIS